MIKIFIDINIFISAYFFNGNKRKIVYHRSKNIKLFTSQQVCDEIQSVLRKKFNVEEKSVNEYIAKIMLEYKLIPPNYNLNLIVRDEKDTNILKSSLVAKCNYLITGDKDLLTLKQVINTEIITSRQLIEKYKMNF